MTAAPSAPTAAPDDAPQWWSRLIVARKPGVVVERRDELVVASDGRATVRCHVAGPGVVESARLLRDGSTWARLSAVAWGPQVGGRARCGDGALSPLVEDCAAHGMLTFTVLHADRPLATAVPMVGPFRPEVPPGDSGTAYRLSRFAYCRRDGEILVVESPRSTTRVVIWSPMGGTLLAALARPTTSRQLAGAHGSDRGEPAVALFRLLLDAGLLTAVGSDGRTDEDADPSIRTWSFHDLLFHARSRAGRHDDPMGGHYPFAGELEPPPATRPLPPGPTIRLAVPDLDAVIRSDPPFTTVLERRRSIRTYGTSPITVHQVGEFLYRCARVRRCIPQGDGDPYPSTDRPYPSAGGAHDLEVYVAVHRCVELAAGVYGYDPLRHVLTPIAGSDERLDALLEHARASAVAPEPPQVLLVVTSRFARLSWKYLGVAYANTQKNVGVLLQTMYLVATAMGLAGCAVGNGDTAVFADLVGTDYFTESSVGEFMLGSLPGAVGSSRDSAYDARMVELGGTSQQAVDAAVDAAVESAVPDEDDAASHLARAVFAERLSAVAHHRSRDEVATACGKGLSWEEVGHAFGMSPDNARQHFGTAPSGLPE